MNRPKYTIYIYISIYIYVYIVNNLILVLGYLSVGVPCELIVGAVNPCNGGARSFGHAVGLEPIMASRAFIMCMLHM